MVRGSPCMCIRQTPTPDVAAHERAPGARKAYTSLTIQAPAATAAATTAGLLESMEIAMSDAAAMPSMTGTTRAISTASATAAAPGRVDSPPTSMMAAPSAAMTLARSSAAPTLEYRSPSEKESGVTFKIPMTTGRVRSIVLLRQRHCMPHPKALGRSLTAVAWRANTVVGRHHSAEGVGECWTRDQPTGANEAMASRELAFCAVMFSGRRERFGGKGSLEGTASPRCLQAPLPPH